MANPDIDAIFENVLTQVKTMDPDHVRRWFDQLRPLRLDGGLLSVGCPDEATQSFCQEHCSGTFTRAAQQVTATFGDRGIRTAQAGRPRPTRVQVSSGPGAQVTRGLQPSRISLWAPVIAWAMLVVRPSVSPLGDTYNPLFLYGNSGLGKTHLLHAVCHYAQAQHSAIGIELLSCEDFVNRFIHAIEAGSLSDFQSQFRTVDLLVIDDIQFLQEREHSQEEFFHTLQTPSIIMVSRSFSVRTVLLRRSPSLEARLISRFNWGLVARVDPPSFETRVAIVQKKAHLRGMEIGDEVAEYIGHHVQANIRELEGALTTIYAMAITSDEPVTLELAQRALEGQDQAGPPNPSASRISLTW